MPEDKSAMTEFLADIPTLDQKNSDDLFPSSEVTPEKDVAHITERDNREARRAKKALQMEREANIALNARLQAITEAQQFAKDFGEGNVDENLIRLYGDDEKGKLAAKITQDLLNKTKQEAREEAIVALQEQAEVEQQEVATQGEVLDEMLELVEDEFNVDLTSDSPAARKARQGFYATLERVSPKDSNGTVVDYADPLATWEFYQSKQTPQTNRAKDLGSRSMVRSGASGDSNLEQTAQERFLRDAGII